jgi:signal transduction histidine kinase
MVVLAFLIPLALVVAQLARERALADAERQAAIVVAVLAVTSDPVAVQHAIVTAGGERADRVSVHGLGSGKVGRNHAPPDQITLVARQGPATVPVDEGVAYLEPVQIAPGAVAVVEVFVPLADMNHGVAPAWWTLAGVAIFLMAASVLVSDGLAARVVRSARGLADAARTLGDNDLHVRVRPRGPRELAEAAAAFNAMADRVATLRAAERELLADLSHRLRTPLTALRLEAERVRAAGASHRLGEAVEAMEQQVDHVIRTARRSEEEREPELALCDAAEVVRERMSFWGAVAEDQSRPYRVVSPAERLLVPLARSELAAALDALLGNVFRYTPQGSAFEVAIGRRDGEIWVRVDDSGPGIDDPGRALRRGASERGSTGLGLDIVRRAAIAGQGRATVERTPAGGTRVVITLVEALPHPPHGRHRLGLSGWWRRDQEEPQAAEEFHHQQVFLSSSLSRPSRLSGERGRG